MARWAGKGRGRGRLGATLALLVAMSLLCWALWSGAPAASSGGFAGKQPGTKYILLWNDYFHFPNLGHGPGHGGDAFAAARCPQRHCFMTPRRDLMAAEDFDAVLVHTYYFSWSALWILNAGKLPSRRRPQQRYIFFLMESPATCGSDFRRMENIFNWTMTYRWDSDIVVPYGAVVPLDGGEGPWVGGGVPPGGWKQPPSPPIAPAAAAELEAAEGGDRRGRGGPQGETLVAWLVSHCATQSAREQLVAALSREMQVDVFGDCGRSWPKGDAKGFLQHLERNYKFYLSFENGLCRDYVTEKLFRALDARVVPVVYGAANYSVAAPPHSYIDAGAFASPKHLAAYLHFLARHPREYRKFFWWKRHYRVVGKPKSPLCALCAKLHQPLPAKSYADMASWWNGDGVCRQPNAPLFTRL